MIINHLLTCFQLWVQKHIFVINDTKLMQNDTRFTDTEIDNFTDDQLKNMYRQILLEQNPEIESQLLEKQVQFLFDRVVNTGNETMSDSEISDLAYKLGLVDNDFVVRKITPNYDFSKQ